MEIFSELEIYHLEERWEQNSSDLTSIVFGKKEKNNCNLEELKKKASIQNS